MCLALAGPVLAGACSTEDDASAPVPTNDSPAARSFCQMAVEQVKAIQSDLVKLATGGPVDPEFIAEAKAANTKLLEAAPDDIRADAQTMFNVSIAAQEAALRGRVG